LPCEKDDIPVTASAEKSPSDDGVGSARAIVSSPVPAGTEGSAWARPRLVTRQVSVDEETMQSARASLLERDQESAVAHRQTLAANELNHRHWFNF